MYLSQQHNNNAETMLFGWVNTILGLVCYFISKYLFADPSSFLLHINLTDVSGVMGILASTLAGIYWTGKAWKLFFKKEKSHIDD